MDQRLSGAIKTVLHATGYYARRLPHVRFPGVAVLCYHGLRRGAPRGDPFEPLHLAAHTFADHCRLIRDHCNPIGADDLLATLDDGSPLPPRAVLVTFDDGYRSVLTLARPILERFGIPAVVFVCSDPVARGSLFWYDAVARARGEQEVERLKSLSFCEWQAAAAPFDTAAEADDPCAPLSIAELRVLAADPRIEIGGHSVHHPILARATPDQQAREIADNKRTLETWTGRAVRLFAYPNGRPQIDYSPETVELVRRGGYAAAFTTEPAHATPSGNRYELPRFLMLDSMTGPRLAHRFTAGWRARG